MADDRNRRDADHERFDPTDPERTAAHRLGPPMRPMRPGAPRDLSAADTGFVDRVTDDGAPVDVAAVRRDDDLIEALAAGGAVSTADRTEFALASLLADWRDEIVTTPVPAGPSIDDLAAAAARGRRGRGLRSARPARPVPAVDPTSASDVAGVTALGDAPSRRGRRFTLVAGAAAAAVAILGGGVLLVNSADPGDGALWSVKEVVFSDAASQTLATSKANAQIAKADEEISGSNQAAAQAALVNARRQASKVKDDKERAALEERIRAAELRAGLPVGSTDLPASTTPPAPSPSVPPTSPSEPTVTVPVPPTEPTYPTTPRPTRPTTPTTTPSPTTTVPSTTATSTTTSAPSTEPTDTTSPVTTTTTTTSVPKTTVVTSTVAAATSIPDAVPEQLFLR